MVIVKQSVSQQEIQVAIVIIITPHPADTVRSRKFGADEFGKGAISIVSVELAYSCGPVTRSAQEPQIPVTIVIVVGPACILVVEHLPCRAPSLRECAVALIAIQ